MAPAAYIWHQAQSTINGLMNATNTLNYYKNQLGSLGSYISKFQDVNYYKGSPCFSATGCSAAEWTVMKNVRQLASESQKKANDALFKGLDQQQNNLTADAATLQRLQLAAQGAQGQVNTLRTQPSTASSFAFSPRRNSMKACCLMANVGLRPCG